MNRKKEIKEELNEIAPFLSKLDKKEGFKVPHNYFEQLPDEIMKQVEPKKKLQPEAEAGLSLWEELISMVLAAFQPKVVMALASIALVVGSFFYLNQGKNSIEDSIASSQYLAYVEENIDDFEEEMIFELSHVEDVEMDIFSNTDIEEQDLDSYLEEVIDDLDDRTLEDLL